MSTVALLSTTYFGPVQWYQKLCRYDSVLIERHETFIKQTYRNRCLIATTQGIQALTVPVEAPSSLPEGKASDRESGKIRISDHGNWRHLHWQALQSAYGDSPFFEFYADDLRPFFEQRWTYLFDFNEAIRQKICDLIDIHPHVEYTTEYLPNNSNFKFQTSNFKLQTSKASPISGPASTPSILPRMQTSSHTVIIRSMNRSMASCRISPSLTCCLTWDLRVS